MTTSPTARHLTEDERQGAADGALAEPRRRDVAEHLAGCADCATDVARLRDLVARARAAPPPVAALDELWPDVRARIERGKVVPLATPGAAPRVRRRWAWAAGAAVVAVAALGASLARRPADEPPSARAAALGDDSLSLVADSARVYQQEAQALLDEMELRRALLRPDVAERVDHDLRVIDAAIAELQEAIAHDPNNPALRQLLAASYRQKRDLLKRVGNAS